MVNFNNLVEASVLIEGKPAREYETCEDEEGTNIATRYIESKPGTEYSIQIAIGRSFLCNSTYCVALCLIIDGQKEYRPLQFQDTSSSGSYMHNWGGACSTENGQHLEKPYIFTRAIPSKDGNNLVSDSEIGTISLEIWRAEYDSARENEPRGPTSFTPVTDISDKTTKWSGIDHITR
ncbi:hypothetical protein EMCG_08986 [[Emmonsia] crescens]|uniref:DUF7918 domain-containing protein n=1 Tax=[Emmonsia] crescens TaxID=73230 RepID=A0A0G2JA60_9EURO|nr:hypothetical protein EMCG_08986 [Emmonsia crescens UAMH 3008]